MKSLAILLCVVVFTIARTTANDKLPECEKYECAAYEVVDSNEKYETRQYKAVKVGMTFTKGLEYNQARNVNFFRLLRYIRGGNSKHMKINMVLPILTVIPLRGSKPVDEFGVAYFLPRSLDEPPTPTIADDAVMLLDIAPLTAYVVKFDGYLNKTRVIGLQQKLHDDLIKDGVPFDRTVVLAGEYTKFPVAHERHNELIYMGKN